MDNNIRRFQMKIIPPSLQCKKEEARAAAATMESRMLHCPYCAFPTEKVFADTAGHIQTKCNKCKSEIVYNLTPGTCLDFRIVK